MKSIISVMLLLFTLTAGAQTSPTGISPTAAVSAISTVLNVGGWITKDSKKVYYVQVEATGLNEEMARKSAYSKAVELAVGATVFTGRETSEGLLTRNEIIVHSGGYVEDYKIVSNDKVNGMTKLVIDVWVSDAKIASRLNGYGYTAGAEVNGKQIQDNWNRELAIKETALKRQQTGQELVQSVLRDLPKMGYVNKVVSTEVGYFDVGLAFGVTITTTYNPEYFKDLKNVMKETVGDMSYWRGIPRDERRFIVDNKGFGSGWTRTNTYFRDYVEAFEQPKYMIIKFFDVNGKPNFTNCWNFIDKNKDGYRELSSYAADNSPVNRGMGFINENFYHVYEGGELTVTYSQTPGGLMPDQFIRWASKISRVEAELVDDKNPKSNICNKKQNVVKM